ncbi:MAG: serine--tRNA ligase [Aestuariivita sp.]|nr:serine--tRNA ligase [Aestuariivita sp.]MCY4201849.1 serine--tRNA ligase [Aestuariivita sp.]
MHDIRAIRENPEAFDAALVRRGDDPIAAELLAIDQERREKITESESVQARQNQLAREIGQAKGRGDQATYENLLQQVTETKAVAIELQKRAKDLDRALRDRLARIANLPADDVPTGISEADNVEVRKWGETRWRSDFKPLEHFEILGAAAAMDFEKAARISGSRFVLLSGSIARIHRALAQFMLDLHINEHGFTEINPPVLVRDEAMYGTDKLPKFGGDSYQTTNGWWLVPTSEVPLTYMVAGQILEEQDLPLRYTAHTLCFRSEAGAAGKDTTGMLRQHQFEKVEMVAITLPSDSDAEQERLLAIAESMMQRLDIPFRTVILCSGDMGFGARRTFDIEAWLPGQNDYREISSISTTGDFQARRMNARYRARDGGRPQFVHTLNGSGLAVGRCLIAVLENGQRADGSVQLPSALKKYLDGKLRLCADGTLV